MSNVNRRLTSILATDCVGFSSHMEKDEEKTLKNLKDCRSIIDPYIEEYGGKIFYTAGDSVIAEFASPVSCVKAAINFQQAISKRNESEEEDSKFVWRVGIHMDDVIIEGENIYGSGVNISARLEAACTPGQILMSTTVKDQVNNKVELEIEDAGTKALKNISDNYQTYGISPTGEKIVKTDGKSYAEKKEATNYKPKLAVMPFSNMNNDEDGGYLVDGVVEDLITEFSMIRELELVSRQSCFDFRGSDMELQEFCKKFDVDYIVSGNIRSSGKRVRISVELSDAKNENQIWSQKFDKILEDIFDVQDEIVRQISKNLLGEIELSSLERAQRKPTENLTSYELLLKGKVLHHKIEKEALTNALSTFDDAIKADSDNGQAYAWKACAIGQGLSRGFIKGDINKIWSEAEDCLKKAHELNDNDFEVHRLMAEVNLSGKNFRAAERHAAKSYKMVPNDPRVLSVYGEASLRLGKIDRGLDALKLALEIDPIAQGKENSDSRIAPVIFGEFLARNKDNCIDLIEQIENLDTKSWLVTAKICSDEEQPFNEFKWFKDGKELFRDKDWAKEVDSFRLNNDSATEALKEFAVGLYV
ncbi:MAG: adenylate/guanylate cyclase domain-containing protein [Rhodobacteraceae bacterium]|nr:MAG: adenylate/guanylate cyclase domain-containing protein [Paracoccaceae bacterium]